VVEKVYHAATDWSVYSLWNTRVRAVHLPKELPPIVVISLWDSASHFHALVLSVLSENVSLK